MARLCMICSRCIGHCADERETRAVVRVCSIPGTACLGTPLGQEGEDLRDLGSGEQHRTSSDIPGRYCAGRVHRLDQRHNLSSAAWCEQLDL